MIVKEYRVPLPMTVPDYHISQLYMVAKASQQETDAKAGEGIQIMENKPFTDERESGQFTYKIIHIRSKLPGWIRKIVPKTVVVEEKSWNAYPHCKTVYSCPFFGNKFSMIVESMHLPDYGQTENAMGLDEKALKGRTVDPIDIANDPVESKDYKKEEDPTKVTSKTGRIPISGKGWQKSASTIMCCYKLCTVEIKIWGLQTRLEKFAQHVLRNVFLIYNRKAVCWTDEWFGLTIEDIRKMEDKTQKVLAEVTYEKDDTTEGDIKIPDDLKDDEGKDTD
mmetsp:Transcript_27485/g.47436  ORF Transcript_27485/g.47436 Transcript_27485/m.47436 type:complete len:279 (+) Transcript_27485:55-891(+)